VPGAKAVFEKFADYVPRPEPASWLAGGTGIISEDHPLALSVLADSGPRRGRPGEDRLNRGGNPCCKD
jgi:hypothetical protein